MKRIILTHVFLGFFCCAVKAQISTEERPYSWENNIGIMTKQSMPTITLPYLDMKTLQKEDMEREDSYVVVPYRFGVPHEVNLSLSNSGTWSTTSDGGRLLRLKLYSPDALSLNLLYDKFWLPDGAKFFIYSEDMTQHIGAFTSRNNNGDRKNILGFATGFLFTNSIVLEYYEPKGIEDSGVISIVQVISGYQDVNNIIKTAGNHSDLLPCHNDIMCPVGSAYQQEKNAVALIIMGGYACTGALLNTTANDNRPVFLTASHCFILSPNTAQWLFYWHYETPTCGGNTTANLNKSTGGANLLARWRDSDFVLLGLTGNGDPAKNSNITPYYLGWNRTTASATSGAIIHHPQRSPKKISLTSNPIVNNPNLIHWPNIGSTPRNHHWIVRLTNGTAEGGSSGSPLLDQNKHVIGQLHGGESGCPEPPNSTITKYYGRFDVSWTGGGTSSTRLSDWLDPNNTGVTILDALCVPVNFINETVNINRAVTNNCGNINIQNVTVGNNNNNVHLQLDAASRVIITGSFKVHPGVSLKVNK